jgi:transcription termination factor NusB
MHPELAELLRRRISIIADHDWRDRDSAGHLEALKEVSERLMAWTAENRPNLDAQLRHYLANASFDKALAHLGDA